MLVSNSSLRAALVVTWLVLRVLQSHLARQTIMLTRMKRTTKASKLAVCNVSVIIFVNMAFQLKSCCVHLVFWTVGCILTVMYMLVCHFNHIEDRCFLCLPSLWTWFYDFAGCFRAGGGDGSNEGGGSDTAGGSETPCCHGWYNCQQCPGIAISFSFDGADVYYAPCSAAGVSVPRVVATAVDAKHRG